MPITPFASDFAEPPFGYCPAGDTAGRPSPAVTPRAIAPLSLGVFLLTAMAAMASPVDMLRPITLGDVDPLTRGICEQLAITAQCDAPLVPFAEDMPKTVTTEEVIRPKPRPVPWPPKPPVFPIYIPIPTGGADAYVPFRYWGLGGPQYAAAVFGGGGFFGGGFGGGSASSGTDSEASAWATSASASSASSHVGVWVRVLRTVHRPVDWPHEPEVTPVPAPPALAGLLGALAMLFGCRKRNV